MKKEKVTGQKTRVVGIGVVFYSTVALGGISEEVI